MGSWKRMGDISRISIWGLEILVALISTGASHVCFRTLVFCLTYMKGQTGLRFAKNALWKKIVLLKELCILWCFAYWESANYMASFVIEASLLPVSYILSKLTVYAIWTRTLSLLRTWNNSPPGDQTVALGSGTPYDWIITISCMRTRWERRKTKITPLTEEQTVSLNFLMSTLEWSRK